MTRHERLSLIAALCVLGAGWGLTQPLSKIAVSTGYEPLGLLFWQMSIGVAVLAPIVFLRGKRLPLRPEHLRVYVMIALIGTLLPQYASYSALPHLPAGLMSILLSLVPMFAFPIDLALALERFHAARLFGLLFGLAGVSLIVLPEASLPDRAALVWIPIALIPALFYGFEGNFVARWGTAGLDPIQVLCGASLVGACLAFPMALASGQWINPVRVFGAPEWAHVATSVIHAIVYSGYVWMVGRAGSVFAAQVSYLVTGFGVFWAMLVLGERYSLWIWAAMGLMFLGLFLVQPRPSQRAVASAAD